MKAKGKGARVDEMLDSITNSNGHDLDQTPGHNGGHWSLVCCIPWSQMELDIIRIISNSKRIRIISNSKRIRYNFTTEQQ